MMRRSRPSQPQLLEYSGAPTFTAVSASSNSYGFDTSAGLGHLSLSSPTTVGHPSFQPHSPAIYSPNNHEYEQPHYQSFHTVNDTVSVQGQHSHRLETYWQSNSAVPEDFDPLPSPPLLTANSLNLPPLFTAHSDQPRQLLSSQNAPYGYPAPPDIPYAESAASSNLSPPEDEGGLKTPMDEEKRRRNLAASARFRQKKKMREQQLEQQTKELNDRATELEQRVAELEKENDFLKALLTEKETDMTPEGLRKFNQFALLVENGGY